MNTSEGKKVIEARIAELGDVDFLWFDNIMCLVDGDLMDPEPWRATLPWAHSLTRRHIGQCWIHHANDQGKQFGTKTRAWQMDTCIALEPVEHPSTDVSFRVSFDAEKGGKARERTPQNRSDFATKHVTLIDDKWSYKAERSKHSKLKPNSVAATIWVFSKRCWRQRPASLSTRKPQRAPRSRSTIG